jgi:cellulose synthase/poly-beta-1,6-N-acetylglucosamine synthase-like glycosyltransferase
MTLVLLTFWLSLGLLVYIYLGYPLLVMALAPLLNRRIRKTPIEPSVTILIPAHNEERCLDRTIQNKLAMDYPENKREIIVISDASTDRTDEIAAQYATRGVRLIRQVPRQGKTAALNLAAQIAQGDILVFSDANSLYASDALRHLVANFADPTVGYVTGNMQYLRDGESATSVGCSLYMRYEILLRKSETRIGSVIGVNGGIDAVCRKLYSPMRADEQPDLALPLRVIDQGYRVVFEPLALLQEDALTEFRAEYKMRVRVSLRALAVLWNMRHLLDPKRIGLVAVQILSHKVLRYATFVFLAPLYLTNLLLAPLHPGYLALAVLQTIFYVTALLGWLVEATGARPRFAYLPFYFCLVSWASAHAFVKLLLGHQQVTWSPRGG